jgi:photosystem II stability/assembly factor-like uncharacterized protein
MTDTNYNAGQGSIWVQPSGPNTKPLYLGCHGVTDLTTPKGDITLQFCPDPSASGKFSVKNSFQGEPGPSTLTIETDVRKVADYLEDIGNCQFPIYIHKFSCGRRDEFANWERSFIPKKSTITNTTVSNLLARAQSAEGETMQTFDISAQEVLRVFQLMPVRISITDTESITSISVCGVDQCAEDCLVTQKPEDSMFLGSTALVGSAANTADVLSKNSSGAFVATAADPFAGGQAVRGVVCFKVGKNTTRIVVGNGTTAPAAPMRIAYSDNGGASWTSVNVGVTNAEFFTNAHCLFALDKEHIWAASNLGRIYFSGDGALTWAVQEAAVISATAFTGINFADHLNGFAVYTGGAVAKCSDGATWSAATISGSAAATDIHAITPYFAWVVGTDGMWSTMDGGTTWVKKNSYAMAAVDFLNDLFGIAAGSAASAPIYMTIDGGYSWDVLPALTNQGYLDVKIVSTKLAYVVGTITGTTGMVATLIPQP